MSDVNFKIEDIKKTYNILVKKLSFGLYIQRGKEMQGQFLKITNSKEEAMGKGMNTNNIEETVSLREAQKALMQYNMNEICMTFGL